jgi:hypothetical protein
MGSAKRYRNYFRVARRGTGVTMFVDQEINLEFDDPTGFALDRSARRFDTDGRLHVADCRISAARVNEYIGSEIPGYASLKLEPSRLYKLYRTPAALKAAAASFENMPLLLAHVAVSAESPQKMLTVGTVSNVRWLAPYLVADLAVWDKAAIEGIQSGAQREISCGYRYAVDMTPGKTPDGESYDGRMVSPLTANHVALVAQGRVGPDCMVGDEARGVAMHEAIPHINRFR